MNILILTDKYPPDPGGLAISTRRLARGLAQVGHQVRVSVPSTALPPGSWAAEADGAAQVERIGLHRRADDALSGWFDRVVEIDASAHLDVIHAFYIIQPAFVAVSAARYLNKPSIISARGNDLDRSVFDPARFSQIAWALQNATAITAVTTDLAHKAQVFAPGRRPYFVPNAVDTDLFAPRPRDEALARSLGLEKLPVIAFVGEARQKKGLAILLMAFERLCAGLPEPSRPALLLVGGVRKDDEPLVQVFTRQNPALRVCVTLPMPHDRLPDYYALADIVALPSLHDGMPNSLLEGMACARAVAAFGVGGILDVLCPGGPETGLLVPPGDAQALVEALGGLLADAPRRERMGQAARALVEAEYTPQREIERNLNIYQSVLKAPR